QANRHITETITARKVTHVAADKKRSVTVTSGCHATLRGQTRCRDKADEFEIGWTRDHSLELGEQALRRRTAGAKKDPTARPDRRKSLLCAHELRADTGGSVADGLCHLSSPSSRVALAEPT